MSEIGREDVVALLADLQAAGLAPQTRRKYAMAVGAVLAHAGARVDFALRDRPCVAGGVSQLL